jgi:hypothetical protein
MNVMHVIATSVNPMRSEQGVTSVIMQCFALLIFLHFYLIPFQFYMLSNDVSTPTFNGISHE